MRTIEYVNPPDAPPASAAVGAMESCAVEAAALLAGIAHPKRLLVFCALLEGERTVGRLAQVAGLPQATLSQHLARMRMQGLVAARRDGQSVHYRLASAAARDVLLALYRNFCPPPNTDSTPARDAAG